MISTLVLYFIDSKGIRAAAVDAVLKNQTMLVLEGGKLAFC